jgi:Ca2+-transporting ATPase
LLLLLQVLKLQASGVYVAMITGDSRETAVAIARSLNILASHEGDTDDVCMSGQEVDSMPDLSTPASAKRVRVRV